MPAIGRADTRRPSTRTSGSGRRAGELHAEHPEEEHVGRGVRDAEAPVDREPAVRRVEGDAPRRDALVDVAGEDVLLERRNDPAVVLVRHVRFAGLRVADAAHGGERRRRGLRDPAGEVLQGRDAAVVAAGGDVRDEDEPLPPVVEHDRAIDREEPDRRARGVVRVGCGMTVEEAGGLVREVPHQPPRERRQVGETRPADRTRRADERLTRRSPRRGSRAAALGPHPGSAGRRRRGSGSAAGSPATKEYRPQRSERSTDSSRMPGPVPATAGNRPTGVDTSASSSAHTGTSAHSRASASNSTRFGWISSFGANRPLPRSSDHLGRGDGMSPGIRPGARRARCEGN